MSASPEAPADYPPFAIGARFRLVPPGTETTGDRIDLIMARGAFGSGEHETTASCLEILETRPEVAGARVLDLGSGTGILAIAAHKLGATSALCVDIAPEAVHSARQNCSLNSITTNISHRCGTLSVVPETGFDLVLANIYGDILLDIAPDLVDRARPGALLLLSGMLWEYNFDVRQRYAALGCTLIKNRFLDEFSTLLLQKQL
jgi:ribosomal protein L11 methyltransferase